MFAFVPPDPLRLEGPMPTAMPPPPPESWYGAPPGFFMGPKVGPAGTPITPATPVPKEAVKVDDGGLPGLPPKETLGPESTEETPNPKPEANIKDPMTPPLVPNPIKPPMAHMAPAYSLGGPPFPAPPPNWPCSGKGAGKKGTKRPFSGHDDDDEMEVIEVDSDHVPRHVPPRPKCRPVQKTSTYQTTTEERREKVVTSSTRTSKRDEDVEHTNPPKRWKHSDSDSWNGWSWKDYEKAQYDDGNNDYDDSKWNDDNGHYHQKSWAKWSADYSE